MSKPKIQILDIVGRIKPKTGEDFISKTLEGVVDQIGMTRVGTLVVSRQPAHTHYMQLLRESHIAAHVHPDGATVISIVSCKYFSEKQALDYIADNLEISIITTHSYKS